MHTPFHTQIGYYTCIPRSRILSSSAFQHTAEDETVWLIPLAIVCMFTVTVHWDDEKEVHIYIFYSRNVMHLHAVHIVPSQSHPVRCKKGDGIGTPTPTCNPPYVTDNAWRVMSHAPG